MIAAFAQPCAAPFLLGPQTAPNPQWARHPTQTNLSAVSIAVTISNTGTPCNSTRSSAAFDSPNRKGFWPCDTVWEPSCWLFLVVYVHCQLCSKFPSLLLARQSESLHDIVSNLGALTDRPQQHADRGRAYAKSVLHSADHISGQLTVLSSATRAVPYKHAVTASASPFAYFVIFI